MIEIQDDQGPLAIEAIDLLMAKLRHSRDMAAVRAKIGRHQADGPGAARKARELTDRLLAFADLRDAITDQIPEEGEAA